MELIKSEQHQCVVAAFAMVMGMTMDSLIERLGHDGLERVLKDAPEPFCFRSFHPQEFVDVLLKTGFATTMIELHPLLKHGDVAVNHAAMLGEDRFFEALLYGDGVIFGTTNNGIGHAVAWDGFERKIYDSRGYSYEWNSEQDFYPRQFFLIQKVEYPCMTMSTTPNTGS